MSLLRLAGVSRYYGAEHVLGPVDLQVSAGDRIGLIGPNGSGKTTLLRMMAGAEPDEGRVIRAGGIRIEYLRQESEPAGGDFSLYEYVRTAFDHLAAQEERLRTLEEQMGDEDVQANSEMLETVMARYARELASFKQAGGYEQDARVRGALFGLGFESRNFAQTLSTLSGGQKARAQLARVLLTQADLLLLDEPTNHLDLAATQWLETYLNRSAGAFVVVSHDRFLLDAVTTKTWDVEDRRVVTYNAGYSHSRELARERREQMEKGYEKTREERERLESFVRKYRAGSRSTQAKSRAKKLEKMEEAPPPPSRPLQARFTVPVGAHSEKRVCTLENVDIGYDTPLLSDLNLEIRRGTRIGVVGPNGSGKSTLAKSIAGVMQPLSGLVDIGRGVRMAYYSQHRHDLDLSNSVLDEALQEKHQLMGEARSFLARFLFRGDDVFQSVGTLSGGEKSRLALAKLLLNGGNFLLLDEPTNHLDIQMREALEEALDEYEGTLLFITHDRALLSALADVIWWVDGGSLRQIDGGYAGLQEWLLTQQAAREAQESGGTNGAHQAGEDRQERAAAERRREERLAKERLEELEKAIDTLATERSQLEAALADPQTYGDAQVAKELTQKHARTLTELESLEEEWARLVDTLANEAL